MRVVTVAVVMLLMAVPTYGQAIQSIVLRNAFAPVGAGARGLGMGGAFIAVADDGTAVTFNPAGLAQLRRSELALVAFGSDLTRSATDPPGASFASPAPTSKFHQAIDFVGLAMPYDIGGHRLVFQMSYQRAVDLVGEGRASFNQAGNRDVVIDIDPEQDGALHSISATLAYQITPRLSLGSSINYWIGEWTALGTRTVRTLSPRTPGGGRQMELSRTATDFTQDQSLRGINVNAGFLLRYPRVSFGGAVRLPFSGSYNLTEEHTEVTLQNGMASAPIVTNIDVKSQLHWPTTAGVGIAVRPISGLTVSADYSASHWSGTYIESLPDGALLTPEDPTTNNMRGGHFSDRNFFDLDDRTITGTADTHQWRSGVEYLLLLPRMIVPLRAGLFRDRSPILEPGTESPRRYKGYTFGTGLNFDRIVVDFAYERRETDGTVGLTGQGQGSPQPGNNPNEQVRQNRFVASFIYRFEEDNPITHWFGTIFGGSDESDPGSGGASR